ncbi:MAG TPA: site-2 protease family protein [Pricia sp.]|nr:site-2 protease family protein [Pricia sp.]
MKGFLELGKLAGVKIEVHWTFALLLIWVGFLEFQSSQDLERVVIGQGFVLVLMGCVVLHELGHALTARRFRIKTQKIILLPIGGVATLDKRPEQPVQELMVALAGPAVNALIAFVLALILPLREYFDFDTVLTEELLFEPTLQNFLFYLFVANVMLVVFNLVPAFPMDGGRVLRALLAFKLGRVEATRIASGIGQATAVLFFVFGFLVNPFLILIAFFIFFGAYGENQMVKQAALLEGHLVKEATLTHITKLSPEHSIGEVIDVLLAGTEKDFVVTENDRIIGIVTQKDIIKNARTPSLPVREIMQKTFRTVEGSEEISKVLELIREEKKSFFPVVEKERLIGAYRYDEYQRIHPSTKLKRPTRCLMNLPHTTVIFSRKNSCSKSTKSVFSRNLGQATD